jgi:hypothetical protein
MFEETTNGAQVAWSFIVFKFKNNTLKIKKKSEKYLVVDKCYTLPKCKISTQNTL